MCFFKYIKKVIIISLLFFLTNNAVAQKDSTQWFPSNSLFPLLEYDLLEVQPYFGVFVLNASDVEYDGVYIPVNIGFRKSMLQWDMLSLKFDLALGVASYTQFEIIRYDKSTLRGGLLNTDFKGSGFLNAVKGRHKFRMQFFHISSHLGDDYMFRNNDFELNDKSVNYEQLDFTYLIGINNSELYVGLGGVITPNAFRERFMTEFGFQASPPINPRQDLAFGCDIKLYEENGFSPDIHAGIGIDFKKRQESQVNLSIDGYYGYLPYSTLDFGKIFWIGASTRIYL